MIDDCRWENANDEARWSQERCVVRHNSKTKWYCELLSDERLGSPTRMYGRDSWWTATLTRSGHWELMDEPPIVMLSCRTSLYKLNENTAVMHGLQSTIVGITSVFKESTTYQNSEIAHPETAASQREEWTWVVPMRISIHYTGLSHYTLRVAKCITCSTVSILHERSTLALWLLGGDIISTSCYEFVVMTSLGEIIDRWIDSFTVWRLIRIHTQFDFWEWRWQVWFNKSRIIYSDDKTHVSFIGLMNEQKTEDSIGYQSGIHPPEQIHGESLSVSIDSMIAFKGFHCS
jgi:hypothetical protein